METENNAPDLGGLLKVAENAQKSFRKNMSVLAADKLARFQFAVTFISFGLGSISVSKSLCQHEVTHSPVRIPFPDVDINFGHKLRETAGLHDLLDSLIASNGRR